MIVLAGHSNFNKQQCSTAVEARDSFSRHMLMMLVKVMTVLPDGLGGCFTFAQGLRYDCSLLSKAVQVRWRLNLVSDCCLLKRMPARFKGPCQHLASLLDKHVQHSPWACLRSVLIQPAKPVYSGAGT